MNVSLEKSLNFSSVFRYLKNEKSKLDTLTEAYRRLLISNFLYFLIGGITGLANASFIFHLRDGDIFLNMIDSFGAYCGTLFGFYLTGKLLTSIKVNKLYVFGMLSSTFSFGPLLYIRSPSVINIVLSGFAAGLGNGLYWSCRHYMTLLSTENGERNYAGGMESMLMTIAQLLAPLVFAFSLLSSNDSPHPHISQYKFLFFFTAMLFFIAAGTILKANYQSITSQKFIYFNYCSRWKKQSLVNFIEGSVEGVTYTMPALLFLTFIGTESTLGFMETASVLLSTLPVYLLGRYIAPKHRVHLLSASIASLLIGAIYLAIYFGKTGAFTFYFFNKIAFLLNSFVYVAIRLRSIDVCSKIENRGKYAYIFNSELLTEAGRLSTIGSICVLYFCASKSDTLRFMPLFVALLQTTCIVFVKRMDQE